MEEKKVDIQSEKVYIEEKKVDIETLPSPKSANFSARTNVHIQRLFHEYGYDGIFGRSAVMDLLGLKSSGTSKLLSNLVQAGIIEPVSGHGKGKYRFVDKRLKKEYYISIN